MPRKKALPKGMRPNEILIDDGNFAEQINPLIDGERKAHGLVPRDFSKYPQGYLSTAPSWDVNIPVIPKSEWSARIKEMEEQKSRLSDVILGSNNGAGYPSLDQDGQGYCWFYSGTGCVMALRAAMNLPHVRLSAHAGACKIKGFRDEGGWGAQGVDFLVSTGVPSVEFWPEKSMSRSHDNAATWANAALHKVTEAWIDLADAQYDRNLTFEQLATCLLSRIPVVTDFNWWGHSVFAADLVEVEPGDFGIRIRNSWTDSYGDRGFAVLRGNKGKPDGGVAPRATVPSVV